MKLTEQPESDQRHFAKERSGQGDQFALEQREELTLGPDDFQRIGLSPRETRLAVIRRAAIRASKSLASRQLSQPNPLTEQQLSRVALSTYRLLDPRQRGDRHSRAHVGRIRPGALHHAGHTEFADQDKLYVGTLKLDELAAVGIASNSPPVCVSTARGKLLPDRLNRGVVRTTPLAKVRGVVNRPAWIICMMVALLLAAVAVWQWGQHSQSLRERFSPRWMQPSAP